MLVIPSHQRAKNTALVFNKGTHRVIARPLPPMTDEEYERRREEEEDERSVEVRRMQMGDLK